MDPPSLKGRIPLTTVSNNHSLQQQPPPVGIPSGNSFGINVPRKPDPILCDDKFFLYRKRQEKDQDPFGRLSDEVLLHIFKWLPKKALFRCGEVCRRFNRVTKDDSLWVRIDLSGRTLNSNALRFILSHGFTILRMAQTEIVWPSELVFHPDHRTKLQYLDLSMTTIDKRALFTLLAVCRNLRKLSLENIPLDDAICYEIAQNPNIETLNLSMCSDISPTGLLAIVSSLKKLHNLNVAWTHLSSSALTHLVTKCNPGMLRLNIAGCRTTMTDSEIASIVRRCPTLLELDVSDCTNLTQKSIDHLCRLQKLEYLALSRCYNINTTAYLKLANLETLAFLDIFGLMSDSSLAVVQSAMGCIGINKFYHSSIARPTIGSRRTSIWGIKTRD